MKLELDIDFCNGFFYTLVAKKSPQQRVSKKRAFSVDKSKACMTVARENDGRFYVLGEACPFI